MSSNKRASVSYIADPLLLKCCNSIPIVKYRASMTHSLIHAYDLLPKMVMLPSVAATEEQIRKFHSEDYVSFLKEAKSNVEEAAEDEFGLGFDCPILDNLWPIVKQISGASLTAAEMLTSGKSKYAINWCGGWHHAQRDSASGFCYVNDIVLAIQHLRSKFDKVLYVDLDVHHGDGVENAFEYTPKVVTLSLHQYEAGFFPGTGKKESLGSGRGRYCTINVPYKSGITDKQFNFVFESVLYSLCEVFYPDVIVCQCGGDALSGDPIGGANISIEGYTAAVKHVMALGKPVLFLGGGGYNKVNTAKLWTNLTSVITNTPISNDIPEHKFFTLYGPSFELEVTPGLRKSNNSQAALDSIIQNTFSNIEALGKQLGKADKLC